MYLKINRIWYLNSTKIYTVIVWFFVTKVVYELLLNMYINFNKVSMIVVTIIVFIEVIADVVMLPGEAFVNTVSKTFNKDFGKTKVVFDSSTAIISAVVGIIL